VGVVHVIIAYVLSLFDRVSRWGNDATQACKLSFFPQSGVCILSSQPNAIGMMSFVMCKGKFERNALSLSRPEAGEADFPMTEFPLSYCFSKYDWLNAFGWCDISLMKCLPCAVCFGKPLVTDPKIIFSIYAMINVDEDCFACLVSRACLQKSSKPLLLDS